MLHTRRFVLVAVVMLLVCSVSFAGQRTIAKVHAGNLVELEGGWQAWLVGIATPDLDTPAGQEALAFTRNEVEGKRVVFSSWTTNNMASGIVKDIDDIAFCNVEYGNPRVDLGALLLEKGLAKVDTNHLPEFVQHYKDIEKKAKKAGVGIWAAER